MQRIQTVGFESVLLFLASLASLIVGVYSPQWFRVGVIFSLLFFLAACLLLAVKIKSRRKTIVG